MNPTLLAIDIGTELCGWAALSLPGEGRIDSGVLRVRGATRAGHLHSLGNQLRELLEFHHPWHVAIESGFVRFGRRDHPDPKKRWSNPMANLVLAEARGVAKFVSREAGAQVLEISPSDAKKAATGNGRAEKSQVQRFLAAHFRLPGIQEDEADALAVGLAAAGRLRELGFLEGTRAPRMAQEETERGGAHGTRTAGI